MARRHAPIPPTKRQKSRYYIEVPPKEKRQKYGSISSEPAIPPQSPPLESSPESNQAAIEALLMEGAAESEIATAFGPAYQDYLSQSGKNPDETKAPESPTLQDPPEEYSAQQFPNILSLFQNLPTTPPARNTPRDSASIQDTLAIIRKETRKKIAEKRRLKALEKELEQKQRVARQARQAQRATPTPGSLAQPSVRKSSVPKNRFKTWLKQTVSSAASMFSSAASGLRSFVKNGLEALGREHALAWTYSEPATSHVSPKKPESIAEDENAPAIVKDHRLKWVFGVAVACTILFSVMGQYVQPNVPSSIKRPITSEMKLAAMQACSPPKKCAPLTPEKALTPKNVAKASLAMTDVPPFPVSQTPKPTENAPADATQARQVDAQMEAIRWTQPPLEGETHAPQAAREVTATRKPVKENNVEVVKSKTAAKPAIKTIAKAKAQRHLPQRKAKAPKRIYRILVEKNGGIYASEKPTLPPWAKAIKTPKGWRIYMP